MPYKPKFCCQCGDKIERVNWNLISSRRFCDLCETEFKAYDWLPRIALIGGIFLSIFGIGTYWQKSGDATGNVPKQLIGTSLNINKSSTNQAAAPQISTNQNVQSLAQSQLNISTAEAKTPIVSSINGAKQPETGLSATPVKIYYCGAQTKKGSPCTHKVKGGGRCWQHPGQSAMLPQEKLLVSQ